MVKKVLGETQESLRMGQWVLVLLVLVLAVGLPSIVAAQQDGDETGATGTEAEAEPGEAGAEEPAATGGPDEEAEQATPSSSPTTGLRVLCAYRAGSVVTKEGEASLSAAPSASGEPLTCPGEKRASLGDRIYVRVSDLGRLLDRTESGQADCRGLVLFLAGAPLDDLDPVSCDLASGEVAFDLRRTESDDTDWHELLGRPLSWSRDVRLTVGAGPDFPLPTDVQDFTLVILTPLEALFFVLFVGISLVLFFYMVRTSPMLKDSKANAPKEQLPFSLARSQMAWWFFLAAASYLLIWLVIGELDTLPPSVLGLIGISSATAVAATAIDGSKKAQEERAEAAAAAAEPDGVAASLATSGDPEKQMEVRVRSAQASLEAKRLAGSVKGPTRGWMKDVLSDGSGISFHRFQVVGWTVLLGLIFLWEVYSHLTMPEFSATLLGLMSISSGTYLGLKLPERPGQ